MSSDRWHAGGADWSVRWSPNEPHLTGTLDVIIAIRLRLAQADRIMATPTGPLVPSTESEPLAVMAALSDVAPSPITYSTATAPRLPDGAVA